MLLNLLNLYSLIFALFDKITDMTKELRDLKPILPKLVPSLSIFTTASDVFNPVTDFIMNASTPAVTMVPWDVTEFYEPENITHCFDEVVACPSATKVTLKNITTTLMTIIFANITNITSTPPFDELSTFHSFTQSTNDSFDFSTEDLNNTDLFTEIYNNSQSSVYQYTQSPTLNMTTFSDNVTYTYGDNDTDYVDESDTDYESLFLDDDPFAFQNGNKNLSELSSTRGYATSLFDGEHRSSSQADSTESSEYLIRENDRKISQIKGFQLEASSGTEPQDSQYTTEVPTTNELCYVKKCITLSSADYGNPFGTEQSKVISAKASDDYLDSQDSDIMPVFSALIEQKYKFVKASSTELNTTIRKKLRSLCWETMFGQELVKLTMMDLVRNLFNP